MADNLMAENAQANSDGIGKPSNNPESDRFEPALSQISYQEISGPMDKGLLLLCDHAGNSFPEGYGTLGLPESQLQRHIAYDIGAAGVTRELSRLLDVPALLYQYSRLLIDPNRSIEDPTLVMRLSDGAIVPGNARIGEGEIQKRIDTYYKPYHLRIEELVNEMKATGRVPALFSIHSFTDNWKGKKRIWDSTILWDRDPRFACPLLAALEKEQDIVVGENVPYSGQLKGDCLYQHGTMNGLAHALIEIRQDLIATPEGQSAWAERLARIIGDLFAGKEFDEALNEVKMYGSHTDHTVGSTEY